MSDGSINGDGLAAGGRKTGQGSTSGWSRSFGKQSWTPATLFLRLADLLCRAVYQFAAIIADFTRLPGGRYLDAQVPLPKSSSINPARSSTCGTSQQSQWFLE